MISEIGSEFWTEYVPESLLAERDGVYALSGRTAIDMILQDILRRRKVRSVAMPAWCCESMIAPFLEHGIDVRFYDYGCEEISDYSDVFYLTNFFGYENTLDIEIVRKLKEKSCIILYDRTHSFLMEDGDYRALSDYSFASIRKWMGVVGGAVVEGLSIVPHLKECPYVTIKQMAMRDKYRYLTGDNRIKKDEFLAAFGEFGHHLEADYWNYEMDNLSYKLYKQTDLQAMKHRRRENATYIHEHIKGLQFVYDLTVGAVPLFVPVLFETKEQRDYVRKKLIEKQIYCPIHWPQPAGIPADYKVNDIVGRELSLICDQRYGLNEINREIETIKQLI
jgi:hypothetical protein